jgi:hypothetical protein
VSSVDMGAWGAWMARNQPDCSKKSAGVGRAPERLIREAFK